MKLPFLKSGYLKIPLVLLLILSSPYWSLAQDDEVIEEEAQSMSITDLSNSIDKSERWIKSLNKEMELSQELTELYEEFSIRKDTLMKTVNSYEDEDILILSFQGVEGLRAEMEKYESSILDYKDQVASRLDLFQSTLNNLEKEKNEWIEIEVEYRDDVTINALLRERLKPLMDKYNSMIGSTSELQKEELVYFNSLNDISNEITQKMDLLEKRESDLQNIIFQENVPIWSLSLIPHDSTAVADKFNRGVGERKTLIEKYVKYHYQLMVFHLLIIIGLVLFLITIRKNAKTAFNKHESDELGLFLNKPIAAAYVMSYLFVGPIYDTFPKVILEVVLVSLIFPVGFLVADFVSQFQKKALLLFLIIFTAYLGLELFPLLTPLGRIISITYESLIVAALLVLRSNSTKLSLSENPEKVIRFVITVFIGTAALSIIFGIIGSVQLSHMLLTGTIFSIGIGIVLLLWNHILKSFAVLFFELPFISSIHAVVTKRELLELRAFQVIGIYLMFSFLEGSAHQFNVKDIFLETWDKVIGHPYAFGELQVSIQDFINFFLVLFITVFLARFLKYMFGREILTKFKMERGMPNAVATTIYYFVVVIGFFLAAASTGIQWSKVNLALGAIGVGIGFGLQNVIYNFISGLILIYERPIQVGDTIEFGKMMGPVTEIGIRSSKVLTYEGAEVIVPNGNLISNEVINWTYTDQLKRRELIIKTTYKADPNEVIETIKGILIEIENVLPDPGPSVLFTGFGDGTLDFRVLFWTHLDVGLSTGSNAAIAVYNGLVQAGYEMPLSKSAVVIEQQTKNS
ncbi:MAG: mechanosensitive ion channel [Reichenbachiella sp.]